ncbi:MAG: hypothetical protein K9N55_01040 [Phycisphaerae bacterium]|nr:hypothetical protein [Phycisphaerae bacterium]
MKHKNKINEEIEQLLLQHGEFASEEEAFALVERYINQRNAQPDPALGGFSPDQVSSLLNLPWDDPGHPMQLNEMLSPSVLSPVRFLKNARLFLTDLMADTRPNATATGNLNRRFVAQMMERLDIEPRILNQIRRICKVINEPDVGEVHVLRLVCDVAGLIRLRGKSYQVVKEYETLLHESNAAVLYTILFEAYFTQFNLGYSDGFPDCPGIQSCIPITLAQLARRADQWQDLSTLSSHLLLPACREEIDASRFSIDDYDLFFVEIRILTHLETFGLIECQRQQKTKYTNRVTRLRKTGLFDQFISFDFK